jgi:hypothetical protein
MLAEEMRRLAEEIAGAYESRVRSIFEIKTETAEKLAGFRADLEASNRDRGERVHAELKEMGDSLRSDLNAFRSGLAQFKDDLDEAERGRKTEAREEIFERSKHIANLRKDTLNLVRDFENGRKEMWRRLKSDLNDFTKGIGGFRADLAGANRERVEMVSSELKDMGDRLRGDLKDFMSLLTGFKKDLDKAEMERREEALAEMAERKRDVGAVLEGTQELLKEFGNARREMWNSLKSQLDAFTSELSKFKLDLKESENARKDEALEEISERREQIANLNTQGLLKDFGIARKEMWRSLKSDLESFTSGLAQFKADLDRGEEERRETMGRDLKERAEELRSALSGFTSGLADGIGEMLGELKKDRTEATRAWNQILTSMRTSAGAETIAPPLAAKPAVRKETVSKAVEEKGLEREPEKVAAEQKPMPEAVTAPEPEPAAENSVEAEPEEAAEIMLDEREGLISEVLGILEENLSGLRMVEIAETLGIENWRSLIPIMRELVDDGDVKKEDSTYFIV